MGGIFVKQTVKSVLTYCVIGLLILGIVACALLVAHTLQTKELLTASDTWGYPSELTPLPMAEQQPGMDLTGLVSAIGWVALAIGGMGLAIQTVRTHKKQLFRIFTIALCFCLVLSILPVMGMFAENTFTPVKEDHYYGKLALEKMDNSKGLLYAYEQLAEGVERSEDAIFVSGLTRSISVNELKTVLYAYLYDYPGHFWLNNSYSYQYTALGTVTKFIPSYTMSGPALARARAEFDDAVESIIATLSTDMSELELEKKVHDTIAQNTVYQSGTNAHNAYGCLVEGVAVCEGYAEAFQYVLNQIGIECTMVTGTSVAPSGGTPENHAWNLVKIDGNYYYNDPTWNDQDTDTFYCYFNITTEMLEQDHVIDQFPYEKPVCTQLDANYFNVYGGWMETFSVDTVVQLLKQNGLTTHIYMNGDATNFWTDLQSERTAISNALNMIGSVSITGYSLGKERMVVIEGQRRGDLNHDNLLDEQDVALLNTYLQEKTGISGSNTLLAADVNQDGTVDLLDSQRLYEHVAGIMDIGPATKISPIPSSGNATITLQPDVTSVTATDEPVVLSYTVTLTPDAGKSVGLCKFTVTPSEGMALNQWQLNEDLLITDKNKDGIFSTMSFDGKTFVATGSDSANGKLISASTVLATFQATIQDPSVEQEYTVTVTDEICATNGTTVLTTAFDSPGITVVSDKEDPPESTPTPVPSTPESSEPVPSTPESSTPVSSTPESSTPVSSTPVSSTPEFSEPVSSTVTPPSQQKSGDIDGDGSVNAGDALWALKYAVGKTNMTDAQKQAADLNGDGYINAVDALTILKIAVGIIK